MHDYQMRVRDMIVAMKTRNPEEYICMSIDENGDAIVEIKLVDWKRTKKVLEKARLDFS